MKKVLFGFTLSEMLVAIAIVGIIVALTVPNIINSYQKQSYATSIKKAYVDLQQNLELLQAEDYRKKGLSKSILNRGKVSEDAEDNKTVEETAGKFIHNYYKINKDCKTDSTGCFARKYGTINGDSDKEFSCSDGYSVLLANGFAICIIPPRIEVKTEETCNGSICMQNSVEKKYPNATVAVDINGSNEPNIGGRDMFTFNIYEDFTIDEISPDEIKAASARDSRDNLFMKTCLSSYVGVGCFGKLLNDNWVMNY